MSDVPAFDAQPTLAGELLRLRPLREDDWDALFAVACDPLIWAQHPESDRGDEAKFRAFFAQAMASGRALLALDAATGEVIGSSRYHDFDPERRQVEIGWTFLARSRWGGRFNGEMKQLMLDHAFRFVDRVVFLIGPDNVRSRRAVERIGGVSAGTTVKDGMTSLVYEITAVAHRERRGPDGEVVLRDVIESDLEVLFEYQRDPVANRHASFPPRDREAFFAHWHEKVFGDDSVLARAVIYRGELAGSIGCYERDGVREVGYWIGREFWGQGVATRALALLLEIDLSRPLIAHVATGNVASRRVLEKCGFLRTGSDVSPAREGLGEVEEHVYRLD